MVVTAPIEETPIEQPEQGFTIIEEKSDTKFPVKKEKPKALPSPKKRTSGTVN